MTVKTPLLYLVYDASKRRMRPDTQESRKRPFRETPTHSDNVLKGVLSNFGDFEGLVE